MEHADREPDDGPVVGGDEGDDLLIGDLPGQEGTVPVASVGSGPPEHRLAGGMVGPRGGRELDDRVDVVGGRSSDRHQPMVDRLENDRRASSLATRLRGAATRWSYWFQTRA